MDAVSYQDYVNILKEELVPAMGCTEPIALAYAAAVLRETLGRPAERMEVEASGNIIKNVKSVFVPAQEACGAFLPPRPRAWPPGTPLWTWRSSLK